eukprot:jgi/Astpho2/1114/fgenesh1_pg.00020_%23_14_t
MAGRILLNTFLVLCLLLCTGGICYLVLITPPPEAAPLFALHQAVARFSGWASANREARRRSALAPGVTPPAPTSRAPRRAFHNLDAELADVPHYKAEVVVAHFNDNLSWVDTYSRLLPQKAFWTLYCKGDPAAPLDGPSHVVHLPNVGREAHSHLWHIVERYHNLADHTMFLPGSPDGQMEYMLARGEEVPEFNFWKRDNFMELLENWQHRDFFCPTHAIPGDGNDITFRQEGWRGSNKDNKEPGQVRPSTQRGLGNWMHANVNKPPVPNWCACGMFWVSREHIYRNSRGFYKRLLDLMGDHPNPEDGFFMERAWATVFEQTEFVKPLVYRSFAAMHPDWEGLKFRSDPPVSQQELPEAIEEERSQADATE